MKANKIWCFFLIQKKKKIRVFLGQNYGRVKKQIKTITYKIPNMKFWSVLLQNFLLQAKLTVWHDIYKNKQPWREANTNPHKKIKTY